MKTDAGDTAIRDRYRGCLVGGAAGDALGYAVEFASEREIFARHGSRGITRYELDDRGLAPFSDDTQMTLFTANGLLLGTTRGMTRGIMGSYPSYVSCCYRDWYRTQTERYPLSEGYPGPRRYSWLAGVPELFARRAPGTTCLEACRAGAEGTPEHPVNHSKGCGGVMRVAPVGLYFSCGPRVRAESGADRAIWERSERACHEVHPEEERASAVGHRLVPQPSASVMVQRLGAEVAALTHGHELGWLSAGMLAHIVSRLAHDPASTVREAVEDAVETLPFAYPRTRHVPGLLALVRRAMTLAASGRSDLDAIHELGEGWVAEETLAIAVFCALRYADDIAGALVAAVNHGGDSDSTGAVAGNIVGAHVGLAGIPSAFTERLELRDLIVDVADDLFDDCQIGDRTDSPDGVWEHKYIERDYVAWDAAGRPRRC